MLFQSLTRYSSIFLVSSKGKAGGIPNFKHPSMGNIAFSQLPFLSPTGWGSTPLPLASSLNSLSHLDLHILTNLSRLEISICSQPTLCKIRTKPNISSVHRGCGMYLREVGGGVGREEPLCPIPKGTVVWKEHSGSWSWASKLFLLSASGFPPTSLDALLSLPELQTLLCSRAQSFPPCSSSSPFKPLENSSVPAFSPTKEPVSPETTLLETPGWLDPPYECLLGISQLIWPDHSS